MAGIMTHLVIAREILMRLPRETIPEEALFYMGAFGPDAIHSRKDFVRADKKHTHLRDDIPDPEFVQTENVELFHVRLAEFIHKYCFREDGLKDLYKGYVVHLLTDELYMLTIREEFNKIMMELGIEQLDPKYFHCIIEDMTRNDDFLMEHYEGVMEIREKVEQAPAHSIDDLLSKNEMNDCREWVIRRYYMDKIEHNLPEYITYERTEQFIMTAVKDIIDRLSDGRHFPKIF